MIWTNREIYNGHKRNSSLLKLVSISHPLKAYKYNIYLYYIRYNMNVLIAPD